jgi:hypothetical protein
MALKATLTANPAPWYVTGLGTAAALTASFGHLSTVQSVLVFSLATATGTVITAFLTRPVSVPVISGAAATVLGDFALFGLRLNSDQVGAVVGVVTFALGAFLHLAGIPAAAPGPAAPGPAAPGPGTIPADPAGGARPA